MQEIQEKLPKTGAALLELLKGAKVGDLSRYDKALHEAVVRAWAKAAVAGRPDRTPQPRRK